MKETKKRKSSETYAMMARDFKRTKSEIAFTKLYHKLRPSLKNYIRNIVKDTDVTEDLLAKTFHKIYEKIDGYDETFSITTWAYTIGKRECLRWIKRERNPKVSLSYLSEMGSEVTDDDNNKISSGGLTFEALEYQDESVYKEKDDALQEHYDSALELINGLKPLYRDILVDILFNNLKYKEVALKYDKELQDITNRINTTPNSPKLRATYDAIYKKALQRIKNRVRRGKSLVASGLLESYPRISESMTS